MSWSKNKYLSSVMKLDILDRETEHDLVTRYKVHGDTKARDRLVSHFMKLVISKARGCAKRFRKGSYEANMEDMIADGAIGLMIAINKFDPNMISPKTNQPIRLSTYADTWINVYIVGSARNRRSLVYRLDGGKLKGVYAALPKLLEKHGWDSPITYPQAVVLVEGLGKTITPEEVIAMDRLRSNSEYELDAPVYSGDGGKGSRMDMLVSEDCEEKVVDDLEMKRIRETMIAQIMEHCDERDRDILLNHTFSDNPESIEKIAERHGISRMRANTLEKKAEEMIIARMREHFAKKVVDPILEETGVDQSTRRRMAKVS